MIKPFLIIGLPRSRTAWLSNYFTNDEVVCFHDLLLEHTLDSILPILGKFNGTAESALCLYPDTVLEWEMEKKVNIIIIDRNIDECAQSYKVAVEKEGINIDVDLVMKSAIFGFEKIKRWSTSPIIPYREIDERIYQLHMHLTPQVTFSPARVNLLKNMNITQAMQKRQNFAEQELKARQQYNLTQYGI